MSKRFTSTFLAMLIALATPFVMSRSAVRYAVTACGGQLSMGRAYFYCMMQFFYAAVLFAFVQWLYFAYLDHGTMLNALNQMASSPEGRQAIEMYGLGEQLSQALQQIQAMRPIDIALNILTSNARQMAQKDSIIQQLEHKEALSIPETLVQEVRLQYPELGSVAIANMVYIHPDTGKTDTVPTVHLKWKQQVTAERQQNLVEWLKLRLGIKEIMVL